MTEEKPMRQNYDSLEAWSKKFERSHLGGIAIEALQAMYGKASLKLQNRLKEEMLTACYYAHLFWHIGDINSEKRDLLRDIANQGDRLYDKIESIIHEIAFFHSIHDVLIKEGAREFWGENSFDFEPPIKVDDLLCHLEFYKTGIHRFQDNVKTHSTRDECWMYGNMRYPERIDMKNQHNKKEASTCLMFQLAIFFRLWTHPDGQKLFNGKGNLNIPKEGIAMPKKGTRHDKIIASFVNATFANPKVAKVRRNDKVEKYHLLETKNISESSVSSRLEKMNGQRIILMPWTKESFEVMTVPHTVFKGMEKEFTPKDQ